MDQIARIEQESTPCRTIRRQLRQNGLVCSVSACRLSQVT